MRRFSLLNAAWQGWLWFAVVLCLAAPASGEQAWEEARAHFERGRDLEDAGDLLGALSELSRAMELRPGFRLHRHLGRVCRGLGRLQVALHHYRTFINEGGDELDEEERREAAEALEEIPRQLARLRVEVTEGATVLVDGREVGQAPIEEEHLLDPGEHLLEVRLDGYHPAQRDLELVAGQFASITLELEPLITEDVDEMDEMDETDEIAPVPAGPDDLRTRPVHRGWFYGTLSFASTGLLLGALFGGLTMGELAEFRDLDVPDRSEEQQASLLSAERRGEAFAIAADVTLWTGVALAVVTGVLAIFTDFDGRPSSDQTLHRLPRMIASGDALMLRGAF